MVHKKCPNCGRNLTEDEIYCYFCDAEVEELQKKHKNEKNK